METEQSLSNEQVEYILVPEFVAYPSFFHFFIVLIVFFLLMIFYIYSVNYNSSYTPNLYMFIDFFTERTSVSQKRFENYIHDVVQQRNTYEGFNDQGENEENNEGGNDHEGGKYQKEKEEFTLNEIKSNIPSNYFSFSFNLPFFEKVRYYINRFITNTFYVKGNTIRVTA
jgi:hypothetical protein